MHLGSWSKAGIVSWPGCATYAKGLGSNAELQVWADEVASKHVPVRWNSCAIFPSN